MKRQLISLSRIIAVLFFILLVPSHCKSALLTEISLNAIDRGQYGYDNGRYCRCPFNVTLLSYPVGLVDNVHHRNFFVFDLSSVPNIVTAAQLHLEAGDPAFRSNAPILTYTLFDVTSSINDLMNGTGGDVVFSDLGTGTVYGSVEVSAAANGGMVVVNLNDDALADLNATRALFAIGGWVTTLGHPQGTDEWLFGLTTAKETAQLVLTVIPEPATVLLLALGSIALIRRRQ
jgi:hypothetical protein